MKIVLDDGRTIEGTSAEITDLLRIIAARGDVNKVYFSESRGTWLPIADMHPTHARNALLKIYREWVTKLSLLDNTALIEALKNGPSNNLTFMNLLEYFINKSV